jgi:uncharacterized protein YegP (UPF0339 family)
MPLKMSYQIWQSGGLWHWHLKAENQEIIAHGEDYASKEVCLHAINLVKNSGSAPIEE